MLVFHIGKALPSLAGEINGISFKEMRMIGGYGMMAIPLSILSRRYLDL